MDKLPAPHKPLICKKINLLGDLRTKNGKRQVERLEIWTRNIVDVVSDLIGNEEFVDHMAFKPEKVYWDAECRTWIIDESWTADWWYEIQVSPLSCS